jgi:hypothetical protein
MLLTDNTLINDKVKQANTRVNNTVAMQNVEAQRSPQNAPLRNQKSKCSLDHDARLRMKKLNASFSRLPTKSEKGVISDRRRGYAGSPRI